MTNLADDESVQWVFGYGSLVFRPAFPSTEQHLGRLDGWQRRFWQGSIDHRGIPGAPGRVATLVEDPSQHVYGMTYRLPERERTSILAALDFREKGGYSRAILPVHLAHRSVQALVYWADSSNPQYLGPASLEEMARQIAKSHGPSGPNADYVLQLESALVTMGVPDPDLNELAHAVRIEVQGTSGL